jgi:RecB family exonuclease
VDEAVPVRDENERAIGSGGKEQAVGSGENGRAAVSGEKERAAGPYGAAASFAIEKTRDELDEVWTMASRIAAMLREGAYRAKDIAVITNRKTAYEPILSAAATQRGIPIDTGRARTGVFGDFVDAFLVLVETPGDLIASRAIMTSPLFPALGELFPAREGSGGPAGSGDTRGRGGSAGSGGSRGPGEPAGSGPGDALRRFVEDLRGRIDSLPPARRMRVIADRVLDPVCASFSKETGDDSVYRELSNLLDAWDRYTDAVDNWGGGEGVGAFAAVEKGFSGRGVETRGDRVSVLSPREARGRFFPVVFVPGCSELLFPSASRDARILPFAALEAALRRALPARPVSLYRARDVERQLSDEHHLMYIALTRSLERLYITAPKTLLDEEYPVPSAVLERSVPEKCYTETSSENKTPPQIRFAGMWAANASGRAAATALDRLSPAGAQWHAAKPEAVAVALEPFRLSQSSLRDFLKCERQFFYRKVLRIHEPDSPSALVGRLLHDVMSELGGWFPSKIELLSGATPEVVHVAIDNALQRAGAVAKRSFLERALHYHLGGVVERILDIERSDPENTTIVATELPIDFSRGPWEFTGRIDRIDETTAGARVIIDYKTGKFDKQASTLRKKTLSALQEPKKANWQVPLYVWGMRATEGRYPRAFRLVVAPTKDKPFEVVLFVFRTESDVPPHLKKGRGPSYVVETEIEEIMDRATRIAETIFSPRVRFEKTDDLGACRFCGFARLCGRESG